jgi:hypothetical protein
MFDRGDSNFKCLIEERGTLNVSSLIEETATLNVSSLIEETAVPVSSIKHLKCLSPLSNI